MKNLRLFFVVIALLGTTLMAVDKTIYDFTLNSIDGQPMPLSSFKGKVVLLVNVASKCGFTPQYAGLEELHKKYAARGLKILGFPCNQFAGEEPGDDPEDEQTAE